MKIKFKISNFIFSCKVKNNNTGKKIYSMLPIKSKINTWGKEIYFSIPKNDILPENYTKEVFNLGEIAFWNQGGAIAIGFGPTPVSKSNEIRLVSAANHWADAINPLELKKLDKYKDGEIIEVFKY
tara:strand:+ start:1545 stop:1922 length:378 start_codon:yes stop_codon:yes gene_type:complete